MVKIVITGPESSGKTKLAEELSALFEVNWVPEYARSFMDKLDRPYDKEDLLPIAIGQLAAEEKAAAGMHPLLLMDTSLEVIKIWSEFRFGVCDPWITETLAHKPHDFYLLCRPDLPWLYDPQRENPDGRQELFELYKKLLMDLQVPFAEVYGQGEERLTVASGAILKQYPIIRYLLPEWRSTPIVFFDGVCNFCNSSVQIILKLDKKKIFRFAPLQSETARFLLQGREVNLDTPDSVVLFQNNEVYVKTKAAIELLKNLGSFWSILALKLRFFPSQFTDKLYDLLARNRYKWFGKKEQCMVPGVEEKSRFL